MDHFNYEIRDCRPADLNKLLALIAAHCAYEHAIFSADGKKDRLAAALFEPNASLHCLVVEVQGTIVGYATYTFDYSTWDAAWFIYLDCLFIEDAYRSYGIGKVLMEKVKEIGKARDCVNMQWQTPEFNERAIKFYKRIGGVGKDKVRFSLPLL